MFNKKALLLIISVTMALSGCMSYGPKSAYYQSTVGKPIYGQVNGFGKEISSICESDQVKAAPFCSDQNQTNYIWVGTLIGQHGVGLLHKSALAVPRSANVAIGDIIEYHIVDIEHPWAVFDRVAARKSAQTNGSQCRWVGSHFATGGVVCDGWRWNKDFPPAAD